MATPVMFPTWLQWSTFIAALLLTLIKVGEVAIQVVRHGRLQVLLTRDVFLRLIDSGESIFANCVMLARNGAVLIHEVELILTKTDEAVKTYPLSILRVGEKVKGSTPLGDTSFLTTSPLAFVPSLTPLRVLYLAAHPKYSSESQRILQEFRNAATKLRQEITSKYGNVDLQQLPDPAKAEIEATIRKEVGTYSALYLEQVQIEPGNYRLEINVRHSPIGLLSFLTRKATSSITFSLPQGIRDQLRIQIPDVFSKTFLAAFTDQPIAIAYPEIEPLQVKERRQGFGTSSSTQ